MINFSDEKIAAFCEPVKNIQYVKGCQTPYRQLTSEMQFVELKMMYIESENRVSRGQGPYFIVQEDSQGTQYAELTFEGARFARNNGFSFVRQNMLRIIPAVKVPEETLESALQEEISTDGIDTALLGIRLN